MNHTLLAAPALLAVLALGACAGVSPSSGDESLSPGADAGAPAQARAEGDTAADVAGGTTAESVVASVPRESHVISTGHVGLRAVDADQARFDVQRVADEHDGQVADEETSTDEGGVVRRARMVLRIPSEEFDEAMEALEAVADLESSRRSTEDVTTQVIDTRVRIRAQTASLRRIERLLQEADGLNQIVAIEAELTRRQAELDSLEQQQAWLADQSAMSTITVHLTRIEDDEAAPAEDETGFLAGLAQGWHWLAGAATAVATLAGRLLPAAVALTALGLPIAWGLRRVARRTLRRREDRALA